MKVLLINRPKHLWIGGDYVQMEKTAEALVKLGVEVEISETPLISPAIRMREFDIVHTFNFIMDWSKYAIWCGKSWKKKVVCSMIYHDLDKFIPYEQQQIMADNLDSAIFLAQGEYDRFKKNLKIDESKVSFVPNGIDEFWFSEVKSNNKEDFVLTVGRLDGTKGQFELAVACKELGIKLVCVGERNDKNYSKLCEEAGAILTGPMEKEDLIKMYASCKVFALNSKAEVMPLTVMEAGAQGKPVLLADTCEYKFNNVIWTKNDIKSVSKNLATALKLTSNEGLRQEMKDMTWEATARQIKAIYDKICT